MAFLPKLQNVGGDLNVTGIKNQEFPALESIGGNFILVQSGMPSLPPCIRHIGGDVILSDQEPQSLMESAKLATRKGILKGNILVLITNFA